MQTIMRFSATYRPLMGRWLSCSRVGTCETWVYSVSYHFVMMFIRTNVMYGTIVCDVVLCLNSVIYMVIYVPYMLIFVYMVLYAVIHISVVNMSRGQGN